jgi:tetraacyldisaccharide 4'-kinase
LNQRQSRRSQQSLLQRFFLKLWYRPQTPWSILARLLWPASKLFEHLAKRRRTIQQVHRETLPVPLVVVGNISAGGTGKTPVVIALVNQLAKRGAAIGVITRGYGRLNHQRSPVLVTGDSQLAISGDEAALIVRATGVPVVVGSDRLATAKYLLQQFPDLDLIISDDGLQHYRLPRQMEIAVIDGERGLGNGYCLPAGPLREPVERLMEVDWRLCNGQWRNRPAELAALPCAEIALRPLAWHHLKTQVRYPLKPLPWSAKRPVAVAAIGHPPRFFETLVALGVHAECRPFDDHHPFAPEDFIDCGNRSVLMTSKDAVKCSDFAGEDWWALEVEVDLPEPLLQSVLNLVTQHRGIRHKHEDIPSKIKQGLKTRYLRIR